MKTFLSGETLTAADLNASLLEASNNVNVSAQYIWTNTHTFSNTITLSVGANFTAYNIGNITSGTVTPSPTNSNYQYYTNNGAHTFAAPSTDCAIDILITNGSTAGSITFSGYTIAAANYGDQLTTTNAEKFLISVRRINAVSTYVIKALQ